MPTHGLKADLVARLQENIDGTTAAGDGDAAAKEVVEEVAATADEVEIAAEDDAVEQEQEQQEEETEKDVSPQPDPESSDLVKESAQAEAVLEKREAENAEEADAVADNVKEATGADGSEKPDQEPSVLSTIHDAHAAGSEAIAATKDEGNKKGPRPRVTQEWLDDQVEALSSSVEANDLQVAGHPGTVRSLTAPGGEALILKKSLKSEVDFYNALHEPGKGIRKAFATQWTPRYYGASYRKGSGGGANEEPLLALEDLAANFDRANVMDIKLGTQLWDEADASPEKKERMEAAAKSTTSFETGARLTGWKTWDPNTQSYNAVGKSFGKGIVKGQLGMGLKAFLGLLRGGEKADYESVLKSCEDNVDGGQTDKGLPQTVSGASQEAATSATPMLDAQLIVSLVESHLLPQLDRLIGLLSELEVRIRGGSLLVVFEGNSDSLAQRHINKKLPTPLKIRVIDFAHARFVPGEGPDEGLLKGLQTVRQILRDDILRPNDIVPLADLASRMGTNSEDGSGPANNFPPSRALRVEGLVRPMTLSMLRDRCRELGGETGQLDNSLGVGDGGVWLDSIKSSGWVLFRHVSSAQALFKAANGQAFPTSDQFRQPVTFVYVPEALAKEYAQREETLWQEKKAKAALYVRLPSPSEDAEAIFFFKGSEQPPPGTAVEYRPAANAKNDRGDKKRKAAAVERTNPYGENGSAASKARRLGMPDRRAGPYGTTIKGVASTGAFEGDTGASLVGRMGGYEGRRSGMAEPMGRSNKGGRPAQMRPDDDPRRPPLPEAASVDLDPRPTLRGPATYEAAPPPMSARPVTQSRSDYYDREYDRQAAGRGPSHAPRGPDQDRWGRGGRDYEYREPRVEERGLPPQRGPSSGWASGSDRRGDEGRSVAMSAPSGDPDLYTNRDRWAGRDRDQRRRPLPDVMDRQAAYDGREQDERARWGPPPSDRSYQTEARSRDREGRDYDRYNSRYQEADRRGPPPADDRRRAMDDEDRYTRDRDYARQPRYDRRPPPSSGYDRYGDR